MIALIGATGYVGQAFVKELVNRKLTFFEIHRKNTDYYDIQKLVEILSIINADFVINCAGYTGKPNVDACETNKGECRKGNIELPKVISNACALVGIPWGHVSSGCIYTGNRLDGAGFTEEDPPNFHHFSEVKGSYYSGTKAEAEDLIKVISEDYYIWRLRIPFNNEDGPRNYLSKVMNYDRLLEAENSVTHLGDFVSSCIDLYQNKASYGIYNVVNSEPITTSFVVSKIKEILNLDKSFEFFSDEKEFYQVGASAPRSNCVLDNSKLIRAGVNIRSSSEAIEDSLRNWAYQDELLHN